MSAARPLAITFLLCLSAFVAVPMAQAAYPNDCEGAGGPDAIATCLATGAPGFAGGQAGTVVDQVRSMGCVDDDPVWAAACTIAVETAGFQFTNEDFDTDQRPDRASLVVDTPDAPNCGTATPPAPVAVPCTTNPTVYVQLDYFYTDASAATSDEWYADGPAMNDFAVDIMLYNPAGGRVHGGNEYRMSFIFAHSSAARFGAQTFDVALYAPTDGAPDGKNCLVCIDAGDSIVFGDGSNEGILDVEPAAGSRPNQWQNGQSALVVVAPTKTPLPGPSFADGQGIVIDAIHVKERAVTQDPGYSDLDDDGDMDTEEIVVCGTNPTNKKSTCDDLDGDGIPNGPDDDDYEAPKADTDGDGVIDEVDNCDNHANTNQANHDGDAEGNACDLNDDNDGKTDDVDPCPFSNPIGTTGDGDSDGCKDAEDRDDDGDGICDGAGAGPACTGSDNCASTSNADQANLDGDAQGDLCDDDKDGDGAVDAGEDGEGLIMADCDSSDPEVGAATVNCDLDPILFMVAGGVLTAADDALILVTGIAEDLEGSIGDIASDPVGFAQDVVGVVPPLAPLLLYPECRPTGTGGPRCDDDTLDQRDQRDLDNDGNKDEPSGQHDLLEERVLYTRESAGLVDLTVLTPVATLGRPAGPLLHLFVNQPAHPNGVVAWFEQSANSAAPFATCVHEDPITGVTFGYGATVAAACADRQDPFAEANAIGVLVGNNVAAQAMTVPAKPTFAFLDANSDGMPEALELNLPDPASCGPVGAPGPALRVKCSAYSAPLTIPIGGVPTPEALLGLLCASEPFASSPACGGEAPTPEAVLALLCAEEPLASSPACGGAAPTPEAVLALLCAEEPLASSPACGGEVGLPCDPAAFDPACLGGLPVNPEDLLGVLHELCGIDSDIDAELGCEPDEPPVCTTDADNDGVCDSDGTDECPDEAAPDTENGCLPDEEPPLPPCTIEGLSGGDVDCEPNPEVLLAEAQAIVAEVLAGAPDPFAEIPECSEIEDPDEGTYVCTGWPVRPLGRFFEAAGVEWPGLRIHTDDFNANL